MIVIKRHKLIFILIILLCSVWAFISIEDKIYSTEDFFLNELEIQITDSDIVRSQQIQCYKDNKGDYYFFTPGFIELSDVSVQFTQADNILIGDQMLHTNDKLEQISYNTSYDVKVRDEKNTVITTGSIKFLSSSHIASIFISTSCKDIKKLEANKKNKDFCDVTLMSADGKIDYADDFAEIGGRGNFTWTADKKSYNLQFHNSVSLLGMGSVQSWNLMANYYDNTMMRNEITYSLAEKIDLKNTSMRQYIDLYIDGEYRGVYQLTSSVKDEGVLTNSNIEYLFHLDFPQREPSIIKTQLGASIAIDYPTVLSDNIEESIMEQVTAFEDNLQNNDYIGLKSNIDISSWVKKYIVEECSKNQDAGACSQYFYMNGDSPVIYAGPVWDYDLAWGNRENGDMGIWDPRGLIAIREYKGIVYTPWYGMLYENPEFNKDVLTTYTQTIYPYLKNEIPKHIDEIYEQIKDGVYMDSIRWNKDINYYESVNELKSFISERSEFLRDIWTNHKAYSWIILNRNVEGTDLIYYDISESQQKIDLPIPTQEGYVFKGWYLDSEFTKKYEQGMQLSNQDILYAKWSFDYRNLYSLATYFIVFFFLFLLAILVLIDVKQYKARRRKMDAV